MTVFSPYRYRLELQRAEDGARFPGDAVPDAFLQEAREQAVFLSQRRGLTGPDPSTAATEDEPVFSDDGDGHVVGVRVRVGANGKRIEKQFGLNLFTPYARLQAVRLAQQGHLKKDSKFVFRVL